MAAPKALHQKRPFKLIGLGKSLFLAKEVADLLGAPLVPLQEEKFADGETKLRPLEPLEDHDVIVVQSMSSDVERGVNEKISELLIFISLLKDLGAASITAVLPYLSYSRSDQVKDFQDPLVLKYLARLYETAGIEKILTLDVHNIAAFENAFRCQCLNLEAAPLFCAYLRSRITSSPLVVMSPDIGGIKRVEKFRRDLQTILQRDVAMAFLEKYRDKEGLTGTAIVGSVQKSDVIIFDDMISTGKTVLRAAEAVHAAGAQSIRVFSTHGLFSENKERLLESSLIDEIVVTNSNPSLLDSQYQLFSKLKIISCGPIIADRLRSIYG